MNTVSAMDISGGDNVSSSVKCDVESDGSGRLWWRNYEGLIDQIRVTLRETRFAYLLDTVASLDPTEIDRILGSNPSSSLLKVYDCMQGFSILIDIDAEQEDFRILPWCYVRYKGKQYSMVQDLPQEVRMTPKLLRMRFFFHNVCVRRFPQYENPVINEDRHLGCWMKGDVFDFFSIDRGTIPVICGSQTYYVSVLDSRPDQCPVSVPFHDQEAIRARVMVPEWIDKSPTDLSIYPEEYDHIEASHRDYVSIIVAKLDSSLHLIAPGDGRGLVAGVASAQGRTCSSGDLISRVGTRPDTLLETFEETYERGVSEAKKLGKDFVVIASYISVFLTSAFEGKCLWVDTPKIMDRFSVVPISYNVYISGDWKSHPVIPFVRQDAFRRAYKYTRPPYYLNLMTLEKVFVRKLSPSLVFMLKFHDPGVSTDSRQVFDFVRSMGRRCSLSGSGLPLIDDLEDVGQDFYFVPIGVISPPLSEAPFWNGISPINQRCIYQVSETVPIPEKMGRKTIGSKVYVWAPDSLAKKYRRRVCKGSDVYGNVRIDHNVFVDHMGTHFPYSIPTGTSYLVGDTNRSIELPPDIPDEDYNLFDV